MKVYLKLVILAVAIALAVPLLAQPDDPGWLCMSSSEPGKKLCTDTNDDTQWLCTDNHHGGYFCINTQYCTPSQC